MDPPSARSTITILKMHPPTIPVQVLRLFVFLSERMAREAMHVCLWVSAAMSRNSVLIISDISFRDCHEHIFSANLSRIEIAVNVNVPLLAWFQMAEFNSKRINSTQHVVKHKQPADLAGCSLSMMLLSSIINISVVQERITLLRWFFFSLISSACCLHEVAHLQLLLTIIDHSRKYHNIP